MPKRSKKEAGASEPTTKAIPSSPTPPIDAPTDETSSFEYWPTADRPRAVYVAGARELDRLTLLAKGYNVVDVLQLPRGTAEEHAAAIEGWLQGMSEGSIVMDKERRLSLELEARARGLLVNRSMRVEVNVKAGLQTIDELLKGRESRFTLNGASTKRIAKAAEAALTPGIDTRADSSEEN